MVVHMTWVDNAVIYQIYPRSFADASGDGVGDIAGIRSRLPYLRDLGVNAVWLSPWYVSPMADAGYDVADYRDIDPVFGTLTDAKEFIAEAHSFGIRVIVDIVPNHCSDQHPAFLAALAAGPGSPERELFHFYDEPLNDWVSHFGGSAWTQVPDGQYYLHLFAPEQPDWNWEHPRVREDFLTTLRFWLDLGVDGFRIDVADHLVKDLRANGGYTNQDGVHEIYRQWRKVLDSYPHEPIFVGELWAEPDELAKYLRPDELHTGFNFPFLVSRWQAGEMRDVIEVSLTMPGPATWVLSNHDVVRPVTRYGRDETGHHWLRPVQGWNADLALGLRRSRAAGLLCLGLPGCAYVYQGEELGLAEVEDIPESLLQDPRWIRSGFTDYGRDGCRVPLPWSGTVAPFGFSADGVTPWLPQPASWAGLTAAVQETDPASMLSLYRSALRLRPALTGALEWVDAPIGVLAFRRGEVTVIVNFTAEPVPLPPHTEVLLSSAPLDGALPGDSAAWLR
jgi:alpha-glucosidase